MNTITASEGKVFKRIHDNFIMGNEIVLGVDYSTGEPRTDLPEYYEEIDLPEYTEMYLPIPDGWKSATCNKRIVAPISVVNNYPMLLFDLTVVRKLQLEQEGTNVHIYCNYIEPEHQALIDASQGVIYIETKNV